MVEEMKGKIGKLQWMILTGMKRATYFFRQLLEGTPLGERDFAATWWSNVELFKI